LDVTTSHISEPNRAEQIVSPAVRLRGFKEAGAWLRREATWLAPLAMLPLFLAAALTSGDNSDTTRAMAIILPALFYCGYAISCVQRFERRLTQRQSRLEREMSRRVDEFSPNELRLSRRYFEMRLQQEIKRSQRHGLPLCVVTVATSPERYRAVNTSRLADLTARVLRAEDSAGRLARHIYALYLPHTTPAGANVVIDRLSKALAETEPKFGLAYLEPGHGATAEQLVEQALEAEAEVPTA
jgi:GGDEF domain-containing protein